MGILDDMQSALNRGVAGANRATSAARIRRQMASAEQRRRDLAAQLGASLYEATKADPTFRAGREALYDAIAATDAERANCQAALQQIEAEAALARTIECPFCHARVDASASFCSVCGASMAQINAALATQTAGAGMGYGAPVGGATCPTCGAPVTQGDTFCMSCGQQLAWDVPAAGPADAAAPADGTAVASEAPASEASAPSDSTPSN